MFDGDGLIGRAAFARGNALGKAEERCVTSVVSLHVANSANVPLGMLVDMQHQYPAKPTLLAILKIDRALDNCRKVLYHSRRIGLPVVFVRMIGESAFFNRATPFVLWVEGFSALSRKNGFRTGKPVMLLLRAVRGTGEPEPRRHRAGRIGGRGLLVDLDRSVPSKPQGELAVRSVSQRRARGNVGRRGATTQFPRYRECTPRCMRRRSGSPQLRLAS